MTDPLLIFIDAADDATTDYDGTTRKATYLHPDITACSAINIG